MILLISAQAPIPDGLIDNCYGRSPIFYLQKGQYHNHLYGQPF